MTKNTAGQTPTSYLSSNVISTLEARAVDLLKDESKYKPAMFIPNHKAKSKFFSKSSQKVKQKKPGTAINYYSSRETLTLNTINSDGGTEGPKAPSSTKNTTSDVSRQMFLKHLKSPLRYNELYSKLKDTDT